MRKQQVGVTIMGLLIALVLFIVLALFAMKVLPSFMEYRTARSTIQAVAAQAQNANDARRLFEMRSAVDDITTIKPTDLEITRENNQTVIAFAYRKEIPLFKGVGLYIDYAADSRGQ